MLVTTALPARLERRAACDIGHHARPDRACGCHGSHPSRACGQAPMRAADACSAAPERSAACLLYTSPSPRD
eukprot:3826746-Alexandrium_andersonii.AAC.1